MFIVNVFNLLIKALWEKIFMLEVSPMSTYVHSLGNKEGNKNGEAFKPFTKHYSRTLQLCVINST